MSTRVKLSYRVLCDDCEVDSTDHTDYSGFPTAKDAESYALMDEGWELIDGKHYCCACFNNREELGL